MAVVEAILFGLKKTVIIMSLLKPCNSTDFKERGSGSSSLMARRGTKEAIRSVIVCICGIKSYLQVHQVS